jgi:hypothetical protein
VLWCYGAVVLWYGDVVVWYGVWSGGVVVWRCEGDVLSSFRPALADVQTLPCSFRGGLWTEIKREGSINMMDLPTSLNFPCKNQLMTVIYFCQLMTSFFPSCHFCHFMLFYAISCHCHIIGGMWGQMGEHGDQ